ncbi:MAG: endonuclease/exonuclease/phosphatase family protein [Planctomycetota bacterium]
MSDAAIPKHAKSRWVRAAVSAAWLVGGGVAAASVAGWLGEFSWRLDLLSHFRLQYAGLLLPAMLVFAWRRRWAGLGVCGVVWVMNVSVLLPFWWPPPEVTPEVTTGLRGGGLSVVAWNVFTDNRDYAAAAGWLVGEAADVLALQEVDAAWVLVMDRQLTGYRRLATPTVRQDNFGLAVYVRDGVGVSGVDWTLDVGGVPRVEAVVAMRGGGAVRVIAGHTLPPVSGAYATTRDRQIAELGQRAAASPEPVVVVGDLNATRFAAPLRRLARETDLRDAAGGFGWVGTWPDHLGFTGMIPLDHAWVGPPLRVEHFAVGPPGLGSDHRPIRVDVSLITPP